MDFGKARKTIGKFFLGNSISLADSWGWSTPGEWSKADLTKQYVRVVYAVVSAIAEDAAKMAFYVNKTSGNKPLPVAKHAFLELLRKPNPEMSQFQFLEMHFTFLKLTGESFWYLVKGESSKKPKELWLLRPSLMSPVIDKDSPTGALLGWEMAKTNGSKTPFDLDEIVHFKMPNPNDPIRGLGTVAAAKAYIETEEYASTWTRNSIFNSGRPSGIMNIKGTITATEFESVKKQYKDTYAGTKNAGKTMFLKGADGIDYQKLGMELGEVALKELKDMTRDDIMMMFRVSKTMLGISDDVNRANAQENHAVFIENVIKPECDRFIDHINAFVLPLWGQGFELGYKDPDLQSEKDRLEEWKAGHNKWLTTNDIRIKRGLDPLPGGDVIREPINLVPQGSDFPTKETAKSVKKKEVSSAVNLFKELTLSSQLVWEEKYKQFMKREFSLQEKEILAGKKQDFPDWLFDVDASNTRIAGTLNPMGLALLQEAAKFALDLANDTDTEFLINERVRTFIHERVEKLSKETNDYSVKIIEQTIAEGVANGETITELRKRIREVYENADKVRAERIARTEVLAASNEGANEAYRQSPLVRGKQWSAEAGACPGCEELDGKIVGLDQEFARLGENVAGTVIDYLDIQTPPLHPNCRCSLLPVAVS